MSLLITTTAQLRQFVSFSGDLASPTLLPSVRAAQTLLARYVGPVLLAELATSTPSADQSALLPVVQAPIAALALLTYTNAGNVRITDLGLMRTKTADSGDAFEWQVERVASELKRQAFDGIEALLAYLETVLDKFPAYTASEPYKQEKSRLIRSAFVFNTYYDIASSRLVFQTLLPSLRTAELTVSKVLGSPLATALQGSSLSDDQAAQLDAARRALVYLTIARALRERLISITDAGVLVNGVSQFGTINYKQPVTDKQLATSIAYFDEQAAGFLTDLNALIPAEPSSTPSTGSRVTGTSIVSF